MFSFRSIRLMLCLVIIALLASFAVSPTHAEGVADYPAIVWSRGLVDADNSVLYSITLIAGKEALKDLTITGELPSGATFVEAVWKPENATFVGEKSGKVNWTVPEVARETFFGPFTVRVTFENSKADDFTAPANMKSSLAWAGGSAEAAIIEDTIVPFEDSGEIKLAAKVATELVQVGDTGVWITVPEGALAEDVTLIVTRLPMDDKAALPAIAEDTWWCSLFSFTTDKPVSFAQPIVVVLPTRRALNPGAVVPVFARKGNEAWAQVGGKDLKDAPTESIIHPYGDQAFVLLKSASFGAEPQTLAVGISSTVRVGGTTSVTDLSNSLIGSTSIMVIAVSWG